MKQTLTILLLIFCSTVLIQCGKCPRGHLHLDSTKSWLPLKGKTQLSFLDSAENLTNFPLKVIDTTVTVVNQDCGGSYQIDYINTTIYLNSSMSDSIYFSLGTGSWLCVQAFSNNNPNMLICNIFNQTKEGVVAKNLNNYKVGNKTYKEVILILHNEGYSDTIDSVFIANNAGIVGFKYYDKHYTLQ
jgi:hypothetical protein